MFLMQSLKSELDALAIPYMIKNEYASGAMGELPWQDTQPELWLIDDTWQARAKQVMDALMAHSVSSPGDKEQEWVCRNCKEKNGAAFDFCWQCEHQRHEV